MEQTENEKTIARVAIGALWVALGFMIGYGVGDFQTQNRITNNVRYTFVSGLFPGCVPHRVGDEMVLEPGFETPEFCAGARMEWETAVEATEWKTDATEDK